VKALRSLYERVEHLKHEVAKFGSVGLISFIIDVGLFNLLKAPAGPLQHRVLTANAVAMVVATTFSYFANRHWTWRHRSRTGLGREYLLFFVVNLIGLGITEACLATSHYALGLHSTLADNISAKVIGTLMLGTLFRFWAYRRWVFLDAAEPVRSEEAASAAIV
jgi:putative flippase GtrA